MEEEEDKEGGEEGQRRRRDAPPRWARSPYLRKQLVNQMRQDPDNIFQEVQICNLDDIFVDKKGGGKGGKGRLKKAKGGRVRGESANWTTDGLSSQEIREYKKRMGFV